MTDEANALPDVVYQSDDPPSGRFYLFLETEDEQGYWIPVSYDMFRTAREVGPIGVAAYDNNSDRQMSFEDAPDHLSNAKRIALTYARRTGRRTRLIRRRDLSVIHVAGKEIPRGFNI